MSVFTAKQWGLEKSKPPVEGGLLTQPQVAPVEGGLLTQADTCKYLCLSQRSLYNLVKAGRLTVVRFSEKGKPRYRRSDLDLFIESCVDGKTVNNQGTGGQE